MTSIESPVGGSLGRRAIAVGIADQIISSLGNALALLLVTRSADGTVIGVFTVVLAAYALVVGVTRATVNEVLSVSPAAHRHPAGAISTAMGVGTLGGLVCVAGSRVAEPSLGSALLVVGACLPLLAVQDASRSLWMVSGRPGRALLSDVVWTAAAAMALLRVDGSGGEVASAWAIPGAGCGAVSLFVLHVIPRIQSIRNWCESHRSIIGRFALEQALNAAARPLALSIAGAVGGLAVAGALQAGQVLFGPVVALHVCIPFVAYPEAARRAGAGMAPEQIGRIAGVAGIAATAVWLAVLLVAPGDWLESIFTEEGVSLGRSVLWPTSVMLLAVSVNLGALTILRAHRRVRASGRLRLASSVGMVLAAAFGALLRGHTGAAWGIAVWNVLMMVAWWHAARRPEEVRR